MKKLLYISALALLVTTASAQQFPFLSGYNVDPFRLSPAYAGLINPNSLFLDHRTDWAGVEGGPRTYMLSYHTRLGDRMGVGGRFTYDKTDIFSQMMILGTYTYEIQVTEGHLVNLGLSAGLYSNSINLGEYYNDPDFIDDPALTSGTERSKIKFTSDLSALYRFKTLEAGIFFSSLMFGPATYDNDQLTYKPMMNYQVHAAYRYDFNETWSVKPYLLFLGGENAPSQVELMAHVNYTERIWGSLMFRTGGIWGIGIGGEVYNGILLNYSYNMSHNIAVNTFGGHQITIGIRFDSLKKVSSN
ncbi:MAG: type IX secretion system membrane protein PorP/SprF [Bacteroidia bacterium]|nr:MAG: type IX secretion system membrane protein PorP/SprF [Bacteroidia bacterium]